MLYSLLMIPNSLIESYKATTFKVFQPYIEIRIDKLNVDLENLLVKNNVEEWAYITPYNPYSQELTDDENRQKFEELIQMISSYLFYEGEGVGEDLTWKPEKSVLIVGIQTEKAMELGAKNPFGALNKSNCIYK